MFPKVFNVSNLNGVNGFSITGIGLGSVLDNAGDFNGDGIKDLILGTGGAFGSGSVAAVIFGNKFGFPAKFQISNTGVLYIGYLEGTPSFVVRGIGDINGDKVDDVLVDNYYTGNGYSVIYGNSNSLPLYIDAKSLDGNNGFYIQGFSMNDNLLELADGIGDFNGDGIADVIIGNPKALGEAGQTSIIFGQNANFPVNFNGNSSNLDGKNGFVLNGVNSGDLTGLFVSSAGDFDGDGVSDVLIGGCGYQGSNVYLVYGQKLASYPPVGYLAGLNGENGFAINGISCARTTTEVNLQVNKGGDINGDGLSDVLIGSYTIDPNSYQPHEQVYVLFGSKEIFPPFFNISSLNGTNGFVINGLNDGISGWSLASAGDINKDGYSDVVVGDPNSSNGAVYIIFGTNKPYPPVLNVSSLDGTNGFKIVNSNDPSSQGMGWSVTNVDINGDGISDAVMGPSEYNQNQQLEGFVVYGQNSQNISDY